MTRAGTIATNANEQIEQLAEGANRIGDVIKLIRTVAELMDFLNTRPQGLDKFASILSERAERLRALDRYERRALSRRKAAIRHLDERMYLNASDLRFNHLAKRSQKTEFIQWAAKLRRLPPICSGLDDARPGRHTASSLGLET